jgi:hypothetical protein
LNPFKFYGKEKNEYNANVTKKLETIYEKNFLNKKEDQKKRFCCHLEIQNSHKKILDFILSFLFFYFFLFFN